MHAVREQRRTCGDDDEGRHQVREDRAGDRLAFLARELVLARSALDDSRLQVQLHVGGDRRSRGGDHEQQIRGARVQMRRHDRLADGAPVRVREDGGNRVGEERDREGDEHPLGRAVGPAHDDQPDAERRHRHGSLRGDPRQPERRADADEVRDADSHVRDQHGARRKHRPADAVLLADQLGEALSGHDPHPRCEHLHDPQREGYEHHQPQQVVAVLCARRGVGRDAARVVAGVGGDQARPEEPDEGEEARPARAKAGRQPRPANHSRPEASHNGRYSDRHRTVRLLRSRAQCIQSSPSSPKRRRQLRGSMAASRSSTVTTPTISSCSSDTGIAVRL